MPKLNRAEKNLPTMSKLIFIFIGVVISYNSFSQKKAASIPVSFEVFYKGNDNVMNRTLVNDFSEIYSITKLKFYVSNIKFETSEATKNTSSVHLIDASKPNNISVLAPPQKITGISFLLGIDSALNCSGAQSGALDPLNDMFWTWNNGYIFFKMEGSSDASTADLKRIEHHIGGFKGVNKTMRTVYLPISNPALLDEKILVVQLDIDKYWNGVNKFKIAELPVVAIPGAQARNAADNFAGMFFIKDNK